MARSHFFLSKKPNAIDVSLLSHFVNRIAFFYCTPALFDFFTQFFSMVSTRNIASVVKSSFSMQFDVQKNTVVDTLTESETTPVSDESSNTFFTYFDSCGCYKLSYLQSVILEYSSGNTVCSFISVTGEQFSFIVKSGDFVVTSNHRCFYLMLYRGNLNGLHHVLYRHVSVTLEPDIDSFKTFVERYCDALTCIKETSDGFEFSITSYRGLYPINSCFSKLCTYKPSLFQQTLSSNSDLSFNVRKFLYKAERPIIMRDPENPNVNSFDIIHFTFCVPSAAKWPDRFDFIKSNIEVIFLVALDYLEHYSPYLKFGVPVNFLKLSNFILTRDDRLELILELKISS